MCGIIGIANTRGASLGDVGKHFGRLLNQIRHRGPDDQGWLTRVNGAVGLHHDRQDGSQADVILAQQRLSIIDLSPNGWQPMSTPDGRFHIIYNGEVYNFLEIRERLRGKGYPFRSTADSEVALAAFALEGPDCVREFIGMFAFVILDAVENKLFLARDAFGIKPLFYANPGNLFAFCSEIPPLLEIPGVSRTANLQRSIEYLRYGRTDHGDQSMFADIQQVPLGCTMEVDLKRGSVGKPERYWDLEIKDPRRISFDQAVREVRDSFLDSVRLHLRSDVPIGICLSGGIDSSAIVMALRHLEGPKVELHTFSYIAEDPKLSEESWIDFVGEAAGATMHKVKPTAQEMVADLDDLVRSQCEPFMSTSMYAQRRVYQLVRENGIKVTLDGQGADEMLAGYPGFLMTRFASLLRQGKLGQALDYFGKAPKAGRVERGDLIRAAVAQLMPAGLKNRLGKDPAPAWLDADWARAHGAELGYGESAKGKYRLRQELKEYLLGIHLPELLRYADRNAMAWSVECRVPFLTTPLAECILSLPEEHLISRDATSKHVFREAMRGIVPDKILDRKDKVGFQTPESDWLRTLTPWVDSVLRSDALQTIPVLKPDAVRDQWNRVSSGSQPYGSGVWRSVNFVRWVEQFQVQFR